MNPIVVTNSNKSSARLIIIIIKIPFVYKWSSSVITYSRIIALTWFLSIIKHSPDDCLGNTKNTKVKRAKTENVYDFERTNHFEEDGAKESGMRRREEINRTKGVEREEKKRKEKKKKRNEMEKIIKSEL